MTRLLLLSYAIGGAASANAIPHFVSGMMGRRFQSPFARPPGEGLSSSSTNVLWGFANLVLGYVLVLRVGNFDLRNAAHAAAFGLGMLLLGLVCARHFGRFHGGHSRQRE